MNHLLGKDSVGDDMRTRLTRGKSIHYFRIRSLDERDDDIHPETREEREEAYSHVHEVYIRQRKYSPKI